MPLYSARPPLTPPRILSVRLRRSWGRAGGPGGGGGGCQAGGSRAAAGGGWSGGRCRCHGEKPADRRPAGTIREGPHPTLVPLSGGDHRCRTGVARCDDRHRDHHCDRGAAPGRPAPRPPLVRPRSGPAAGRRRGRDGGAPAAGPARRPRGVRRPRDRRRHRRHRLRAALADHAGRRAGTRTRRPTGRRWRPTGTPAVDRPGRPRRSSPSALLGQLSPWGSGDVVLPLILVAVGLARHLAAAGHRPHARRPGVRWALAGGVVAGRRRRGAAAGDDRPAGRRPQRLRRHARDPHRRRAGDRPDLAPAAGLAGRGAHRPHPLGGAGRRRRAPARLGAADPGAHPAARRRPAGGQPAGPQPGARAARLALRPEGRPRGRHLGRARRRHGGRGRGRPRADRRPGRRRATPRSTTALAALGAATREALVNAAKHSGATAADLYTEVTPERVSVFVRDRGKGFDPATVPDDRRGLRDSVQRPPGPAGRDGGDPLGAGRRDRGGARAAEESATA